MKTERELFEDWYKSVESQYHKALNNYNSESDCYPNDYIQCRYFAWQASANREGYKLVPLEPNQKQIDAGVYAVDLVSNDSIQVVNVYKAMIGAVDE